MTRYNVGRIAGWVPPGRPVHAAEPVLAATNEFFAPLNRAAGIPTPKTIKTVCGKRARVDRVSDQPTCPDCRAELEERGRVYTALIPNYRNL